MARLILLAGAAMLVVGCGIKEVRSRRVDSLIERYTGRQPDDFDPGAAGDSPASRGFAIQAAEFAGAIEHGLNVMIGRTHAARRELDRLTLETNDSAAMSDAIGQIKESFSEPPLEACATRPDGRSDRTLIWRAASRGAVIIRMPAARFGRSALSPWNGRLILVRHAVRRSDVGQRVLDLPCPTIAQDDTIVSR